MAENSIGWRKIGCMDKKDIIVVCAYGCAFLFSLFVSFIALIDYLAFWRIPAKQGQEHLQYYRLLTVAAALTLLGYLIHTIVKKSEWYAPIALQTALCAVATTLVLIFSAAWFMAKEKRKENKEKPPEEL